MSNEGPNSLRDEMGQGYLSLLDSVRYSFEQAAWGQEGSGNLDDFYRWVTPAETAPKAMDAAELGGGVEVRSGFEPSAEDWKEFADWIDGKREAMSEREIELEMERNGPELGD